MSQYYNKNKKEERSAWENKDGDLRGATVKGGKYVALPGYYLPVRMKAKNSKRSKKEDRDKRGH